MADGSRALYAGGAAYSHLHSNSSQLVGQLCGWSGVPLSPGEYV